MNIPDKDFRIHEGRTIHDKPSYKDKASVETICSKSKSIILNGKYTLNWKDFINILKSRMKNLDIY